MTIRPFDADKFPHLVNMWRHSHPRRHFTVYTNRKEEVAYWLTLHNQQVVVIDPIASSHQVWCENGVRNFPITRLIDV